MTSTQNQANANSTRLTAEEVDRLISLANSIAVKLEKLNRENLNPEIAAAVLVFGFQENGRLSFDIPYTDALIKQRLATELSGFEAFSEFITVQLTVLERIGLLDKRLNEYSLKRQVNGDTQRSCINELARNMQLNYPQASTTVKSGLLGEETINRILGPKPTAKGPLFTANNVKSLALPSNYLGGILHRTPFLPVERVLYLDTKAEMSNVDGEHLTTNARGIADHGLMLAGSRLLLVTMLETYLSRLEREGVFDKVEFFEFSPNSSFVKNGYKIVTADNPRRFAAYSMGFGQLGPRRIVDRLVSVQKDGQEQILACSVRPYFEEEEEWLGHIRNDRVKIARSLAEVDQSVPVSNLLFMAGDCFDNTIDPAARRSRGINFLTHVLKDNSHIVMTASESNSDLSLKFEELAIRSEPLGEKLKQLHDDLPGMTTFIDKICLSGYFDNEAKQILEKALPMIDQYVQDLTKYGQGHLRWIKANVNSEDPVNFIFARYLRSLVTNPYHAAQILRRNVRHFANRMRDLPEDKRTEVLKLVIEAMPKANINTPPSRFINTAAGLLVIPPLYFADFFQVILSDTERLRDSVRKSYERTLNMPIALRSHQELGTLPKTK